MARVAERIQQNREAEQERYKAQRVHGVHPSMIPKPTGEIGRYEALLATIERGEDPFPDDPVKSAYVMGGEDLYSPVNSEAAPSLTRAAGEGGSPERSEGEPGGGQYSPVNSSSEEISRPGTEASSVAAERSAAEAADGLYFPVNSSASARGEPPPGAADAAPASPASRGRDSRELQADAVVDDRFEAGDVAALLAREIDGGAGARPTSPY
jgi:hypothetical protein